MKSRVLCYGLIALFLTTPLAASLCGNCAVEHCVTRGMDSASLAEPAGHAASHGVTADSQPAADKPSAADKPCHEADETAADDEAATEAIADTEACQPQASMAATMDCCLIADAPTPDTSAVPAMTITADIVIESAIAFAAPLAGSQRIEDPRQRPPQLAPRSLYTLHSAFLI